MSLLEIKNISVYYEDALILNDVNLGIDEGEIVCILGRNGVGKTTLLPPRMEMSSLMVRIWRVNCLITSYRKVSVIFLKGERYFLISLLKKTLD